MGTDEDILFWKGLREYLMGLNLFEFFNVSCESFFSLSIGKNMRKLGLMGFDDDEIP